MPAQTVITKRKPAKPQDHQPKATPKPTVDPNVIDLGLEDEGPQEFPVHFLRDDEQWYNAHLPKGTLALKLGAEMKSVNMEDMDEMRARVDDFIRLLFSSADVEAIKERLDDPDDRLDLIHMRALINKISEKITGLPTT